MFTVDTYLGKRFDIVKYNCWDFVREVWLELTGKDVGCRTPEPATPLAMRRRFDKEESEFTRLDKPVSPCIVLMRRPRATPHVGIFYKGKVLSIDERGVTFLPVDIAVLRFTIVRYYV